MKLTKIQREILEFIDGPTDEHLIEIQFAPIRQRSETHREAHEYHKVRRTLAYMIARGLIIKKGNKYEKTLLLSATRNTR